MTRAATGRLLVAAMVLCPLAGHSEQVPVPPLTPDAAVASMPFCAPLPAPRGRILRVSTVTQLLEAVERATPGTTILLADGRYHLDGASLRLATRAVTLRSASGRREAVVLDGGYRTPEIIQVVASDVIIADVTLREAYDHPIHVLSGESSDTSGTLVYNVHILDPGQQAIKVNPVPGDHYTDGGVVACSRLELTGGGRARVRDRCYTGGIDVHQARGWVIRDNVIEGFWCDEGLSEHAIHFWKASRDPVVERNVLRNNARGIGFGMATSGPARVYADAACPGATGYVDHFGGTVRNNVVSADAPELFRSSDGFDCGICLWNACGVAVLHNTVYTANPSKTFAAIEWRFPNTRVDLVNNLVNDTMRERDGAGATQSGNVSDAEAGWFVGAAVGDLHLLPAASGAIDRVTAPAGVRDDIDGDARPPGARSDAGADELVAGRGRGTKAPDERPRRPTGAAWRGSAARMPR